MSASRRRGCISEGWADDGPVARIPDRGGMGARDVHLRGGGVHVEGALIRSLLKVVARLHAWLILREFARDGWPSDVACRYIAEREMLAVRQNILEYVDFSKSETKIQMDRLSRRYDPGMALNEAINRAEVKKRAAIDP